MTSKYSWLVSKYYTTEEGYPNKIIFDPLKILSGSQKLPTEPCIFRGSIGEARDIQRSQKGNIVLFMGESPDSFDSVSYSLSIPRHELLNESFQLLSFGQIKRSFVKESKWILSKPMFIRSNSGFKQLSGQVVKNADLLKIDIKETTICLIADAQTIGTEYRFVIVDGEVISGSAYLPDEGVCSPESFEYAQKIANQIAFDPDEIFTLDVVETDNGLKVVEYNSFSTSGLYQSEIPLICSKVEVFLEKQERDLEL